MEDLNKTLIKNHNTGSRKRIQAAQKPAISKSYNIESVLAFQKEIKEYEELIV
jgi:hypothetical protein